nr:MAG TPA: hypothetical protein [Caudoviricetes sp.]
MIEFDISTDIEKKLLNILKKRTKKFLKYIEYNNIDVEDEEQLIEAAEKFKPKEDKMIFGINRLLLLYTLALIIDKLSEKHQELFKDRMKTEIFEEALKKADKKMEELLLNTPNRVVSITTNYFSKTQKGINKEREILEELKEKFKKEVDIKKWEEAKKKIIERMSYSNLLNTVNVLGEAQAEYIKTVLKELGKNEFIWITKNDDRVREKHAWRHGRKFSLNGVLKDGIGKDHSRILPKEEWGCRCDFGINEKVIEEGLDNAA